MGSDFLGALGNQISSQFSLGENTNHTLDSIDPDSGKTEKYGALGDFAQHFDQSSERRYVEEGYLRIDPFSAAPKQFEVLMQEPSATVFIKKRMFTSVADNHRPDFMDAEEKVYYKAMRVLFQNKCAQIAALEKLSKIQKITDSMGSVSEQLMPIIFSLTDSINNGLDSGSNLFGAFSGSSPLQKGASDFTKVIETLRKIYGFNKTNKLTSWITDPTNLFQSQFGQGTGTIEITNFSNISTSTTIDLNNPGTFSLTISDPYEAMLITEYDIEKAISDATNMFYNSKINQFAKTSAADLIKDLTVRLNQARAIRNASPITIKVDPDTLLGKRVTAILDRLGIELPFDYDSSSAASIFSGGAFGGGANVPPEYLKGGAIAGNDGLDPERQKFSNIRTSPSQQKTTHSGLDSEVSLFNRLISTIFSKLSQDANSQGSFQLHNKQTNYARRKLRFNFGGKLIIQPMDTVHIYMASKSRFDDKLLSGLQDMFSGLGMLQNLNNTLTGLKTSVDTLFNPSGSVSLQLEKSAFVGSSFPNYLWSLVRGQFVSENEGAHVFGGVVESANDQWSDGKFTVSVSGKDNTIYFEQGKVNFKPGVDVFNGFIYDPLTPFKSNFDTVTNSNSTDIPQLLDENKDMFGNASSSGARGIVKQKLGRYAGELMKEDSIIQDRTVDPVTGRVTKVFYAPDGLVYKWKEGIGIFTQFGSSLAINDANRSGNPNIAKQPFAGQDVMNVLSLLVTGIPYNFATYYKAAQNYDSMGADPQSKESAAHSFALSLKNDLTKSNTLWGNFIPFKNLVVDEASYALAVSAQTNIIGKNRELDGKIQQLQELNKVAINASAASILTPVAIGNPQLTNARQQLKTLQEQIQNTMNDINQQNTDYHKAKGDSGVTFDSTDYVDISKPDDPASRRQLRRQLNYLTRRMSYNVRANDDKNLFIVDDTYDKDYDIIAYEKSLTDGLKLYNDEFTNVKEKISTTASLLNLEVFCDTQGHIRCRSPQYNRMPSSVFYKMMNLKQTMQIQIFPQFLDDLFKSKIESLKGKIELLEDQIRLDCAILDKSSDKSAAEFINANGNSSGVTVMAAGTFSFFSDDTGFITKVDDLIAAANPDSKSNKGTPIAVNTFNKITIANSSTKDIFTNSQKYLIITQALSSKKLNAAGTAVVVTPPTFLSETNTRVNDLVKRITTKSGVPINKRDYLYQTEDNATVVQAPIGDIVDVFKVANELSDKIRDWQKATKSFYNAIKNANEFRFLDDDPSAANKLITNGNFRKEESIPEVFEHMIEDETYDDYGVGSASRFIIKRSQIKSISIGENPPPATSMEVIGVFDPLIPNISNEGFNALSNGGNGLISAVAIDYDMWRNYGFKTQGVVNVPFLTNPHTQCGPYACMLLSRLRKNILRGSVTIMGNEYMQPGEVVYIEDRGLLFYVTSVKHNFTYGSSFQTTLELTYGHTAGEYIPTPMDMVGKMIYNNRDAADIVVQRQESSSNDVAIGILQLNRNSDKDGGTSKSLGTGDYAKDTPSSFSAANNQTLNNIANTTSSLLNNNANKTNDLVAKIEVRVYGDSNGTDQTLLNFADEIVKLLTTTEGGSGTNAVTKNKGASRPLIDKNNIDVVVISIDEEGSRSSPSQKAWDAARNIVRNTSGPSFGQAVGDVGKAAVDTVTGLFKSPATQQKESDKKAADQAATKQKELKKALFENIVDCWIKVSAKTNSNNSEDC